jgi:hypothetical protein
MIYETDKLAGTRDLLRGTLREALEDMANSDVQSDPDDKTGTSADDLGLAELVPDGETSALDPAVTTGTDDQ